MSGKCPRCESVIVHVTLSDMPVQAANGRMKWKGVSYNCPACRTILSVAIDPIAIKSDIVSEIKRSITTWR